MDNILLNASAYRGWDLAAAAIITSPLRLQLAFSVNIVLFL